MMFCKFALFSFKHYGYQLSIGEQSLKQPKKGEKQKKKKCLDLMTSHEQFIKRGTR